MPNVPGIAKWTTSSAGSTAGHIRFTRAGFTMSTVTMTAARATIAVRENVAIAPMTMTAAATQANDRRVSKAR